MADKNITLRQKNTSGVYDKLYTKTTATQSKLSTETAALFGDGTSDADAALAKIADTVKSIGDVQVKVVDPNGNPIQGARITGLYGTPTTASDGTAHGVLQTNPISISSPYIDLKDQTADASGYAGSFNVLIVTLPIVGENSIIRVTSSKIVKFSKAVKTVDVCCVGGGGGGGQSANKQTTTYEFNGGGAGGGGGGIVNSYGINVSADTSYSISIGNGGGIEGTGGTTTFLSVSAPGGTGGIRSGDYPDIEQVAGLAGIAGCGNGGHYGAGGSNTTVSEFDDGKTFYSGGGGAGVGDRLVTENKKFKGGSPNGASGAIAGYDVTAKAGTAGIGGGGGGAAYYSNSSGSTINHDIRAGSGGSGLVAIRIHLK